jgi:hypothetical protein
LTVVAAGWCRQRQLRRCNVGNVSNTGGKLGNQLISCHGIWFDKPLWETHVGAYIPLFLYSLIAYFPSNFTLSGFSLSSTLAECRKWLATGRRALRNELGGAENIVMPDVVPSWRRRWRRQRRRCSSSNNNNICAW